MVGRTHIIGGILYTSTAILIADTVSPELLNMPASVLAILFSELGALLPDIDHRGSTISKKHKITAFFFSRLGHRGLTHTPFAWAIGSFLLLIPYLIWDWPFWYLGIVLGLSLGMISHIHLDMLNPDGIPLVYPLSEIKINLLNIKTSSLKERLLRLALVILAAIVIVLLVNKIIELKQYEELTRVFGNWINSIKEWIANCFENVKNFFCNLFS